MSSVNQPRSPPLLLEESFERFAASFAKSAPPLQLLGDRLGRRLVVDQDVAGVIFARQRRDLCVVFRPQLGVLHRMRFQVFLQAGVDQHLQPRQRQLVADLHVLVDARLLGLFGGELHADELIEQLALLFVADLAAGLPAHVGDVQVEFGLRQRLAVDGRDALGGRRRRRCGCLVAGGEQQERDEHCQGASPVGEWVRK